jgi:hypothetical protein
MSTTVIIQLTRPAQNPTLWDPEVLERLGGGAGLKFWSTVSLAYFSWIWNAQY